jgi:hypothetical protein
MRQKNRIPLRLELLEDRWVPATVRLVDGVLLISNPIVRASGSSLTLTQSAANTFQVADSGLNLGTYAVAGNIIVTGSNAKDNIKVDLNGKAYTGNLFLNGGNSNDSITVTGTGGGSVAGNTTILTGRGQDSVNLNSTGTSKMTFGGSVQVTSSPGSTNTLGLGNGTASTTVGGDVKLSGIGNATIGGGKADLIGGSLTIQDAQTGMANSIQLNDGLKVGQNVTYFGGSQTDLFQLGKSITGTMTIGGNLTAQVGDADNLVTLASFVYNLSVGGNLTVLGGNGANNLGLAGTVAGNVNVQLGNGNNGTTPLGPGGLFFDSVVGGDENIALGNGNNAFDPVTHQSFKTTAVAGNLSIRLGNGNNGLIQYVSGAPGGQFNWTSGNGADTLNLTPLQTVPPQNFVMNAQFGNNDDGFVLGTPFGNSTFTLSGRVDGGGRINGNTFAQGAGWTLTPNFVLSNFP